MTLEEVLRGLGGQPLKGHRWTASVLSELQSTLPADKIITEEVTGREALSMIQALPAESETTLLNAIVSLSDGSVNYRETSKPVSEAREARADRFSHRLLTEVSTHPRASISLILAGMTTLFLFVILILFVIQYYHNEHPDFSILKDILRLLEDILRINEMPSKG